MKNLTFFASILIGINLQTMADIPSINLPNFSLDFQNDISFSNNLIDASECIANKFKTHTRLTLTYRQTGAILDRGELQNTYNNVYDQPINFWGKNSLVKCQAFKAGISL